MNNHGNSAHSCMIHYTWMGHVDGTGICNLTMGLHVSDTDIG
jgi:hypothetical protein